MTLQQKMDALQKEIEETSERIRELQSKLVIPSKAPNQPSTIDNEVAKELIKLEGRQLKLLDDYSRLVK